MKVIITGASGFLGKKIFEKLRSMFPTFEANSLRYIGEVEPCYSPTKSQLDETEILIHAGAAMARNAVEAQDVSRAVSSINSTASLLKLGWKNLKHIILISSIDVYGNNFQNPVDESSVPEPVSLYAWSKLFSEKIVEAYCVEQNIRSSVIRLGNLYGPGEEHHSKAIPMFIQTLLNNETLELSTNGLENRYFLFVEDAVEYIIKVLEKDSQQPYLVNIVGNVPTSIYRTAETISSLIPGGKKINIRNQFISGVSHSFNTTKMNNDFQISQTNLIDGLRKEISGFQR